MKRKAGKFISSIVLGGFILSAAGSSLAASPNFSSGHTQFGNPPAYQNHAGARQFSFASQLSNLVSDGTLTQDQADAIVEALPQKPERGQEPQGARPEGPLSQLVSSGTMTQEQADAIMEALGGKRR